MATGNFDEAGIPPAQRPASVRSFRLPADYYSAPLSEVKPVFPAWVPWGCGSLAAVVLLLMFAGGVFLSGPRLATLIDLMLSMTIGEMKAMYQPDVTAAQKDAFDAEMKRMREGLRDGKVSVQKVQPFLQTMQKAIGDEKVSGPELEQMTKAAREAVRAPAGANAR
jgi:hypothetical protein